MSKGVFLVAMGETVEEVSSIKEVGQLLNMKVTKKDVMAGNVSGVEWIDTDTEHKDEFGDLEHAQEEQAMQEDAYELNQHDIAALDAIDARMAQLTELEDTELYDQLNRIKAIIQCGATDTFSDEQFQLVTETMTGAYKQDEIVYDDPSDDGHGIESLEDAGIDPTKDDDNEVDMTPSTPALTNLGTGAKQTLADKPVEYPEVGTYKTDKELKRFYKKLSDDQLDEWLELEGLGYKHCEHPSINRMRKCMAILKLHFPDEPKVNTKSKSKYSDYTTEQLVEMANKAGLPIRDSKGSDQILRMYTIMELRKAGLIV